MAEDSAPYLREAEGAGRKMGHPDPAWAEGESENCRTHGEGGEELGTIQRATCRRSKKAGCEGDGAGPQKAHGAVKGTFLSWRAGAAELDRSEVSGVLGRGGENGAGQ